METIDHILTNHNFTPNADAFLKWGHCQARAKSTYVNTCQASIAPRHGIPNAILLKELTDRRGDR